MTKDELFLLRRKKKIILKDISNHIGLSIAALSRYENNILKLSSSNENQYKNYIINY